MITLQEYRDYSLIGSTAYHDRITSEILVLFVDHEFCESHYNFKKVD